MTLFPYLALGVVVRAAMKMQQLDDSPAYLEKLHSAALYGEPVFQALQLNENDELPVALARLIIAENHFAACCQQVVEGGSAMATSGSSADVDAASLAMTVSLEKSHKQLEAQRQHLEAAIRRTPLVLSQSFQEYIAEYRNEVALSEKELALSLLAARISEKGPQPRDIEYLPASAYPFGFIGFPHGFA